MSKYNMIKKRVYVAGHRGMVGSALVRRLASEECEVLTVESRDVDLRRQSCVEAWMADEKPHAVFLAAARVGGILANDSRPGEFLYDNMMIEANVIEAARRASVEKLMLLGSSCIYPKFASQPITEESLLTGELEPTNQWYSVAKIAGIKLCNAYRRQYGCDFISVMPTNLYGPHDNYDLAGSHVLPALILKAHSAKENQEPSLAVWGSGTPRREFLYVDDLADACVFIMKNYTGEMHINIGTGKDLTIHELAELVCKIVGFQGALDFDSSKPDGTPRKLLDISRLAALGWHPSTSLDDGIKQAYRWFLAHREHVAGDV